MLLILVSYNINAFLNADKQIDSEIKQNLLLLEAASSTLVYYAPQMLGLPIKRSLCLVCS